MRGLDVPHREHRAVGVPAVHLRDMLGAPPAVLLQGEGLDADTVQVQRPALADDPDVGERLLQHQGAGGALHDKHEVDVAVANLRGGRGGGGRDG